MPSPHLHSAGWLRFILRVRSKVCHNIMHKAYAPWNAPRNWATFKGSCSKGAAAGAGPAAAAAMPH